MSERRESEYGSFESKYDRERHLLIAINMVKSLLRLDLDLSAASLGNLLRILRGQIIYEIYQGESYENVYDKYYALVVSHNRMLIETSLSPNRNANFCFVLDNPDDFLRQIFPDKY